ncbi:hypothetical protein BDZ89DRAFT_1129332 [Hymenopellis radicata]|nr:hypothetical protein BDZ89DRAFT_1129332 [Hymenopellis radicata]
MDKSLAITLGCIIPIVLTMTVLSIYVLIQIIKRNRRAFKVLLEKQEKDNIKRGAVFGLDAHPRRIDLLKGYKSPLDFAPRVKPRDSIASLFPSPPSPKPASPKPERAASSEMTTGESSSRSTRAATVHDSSPPISTVTSSEIPFYYSVLVFLSRLSLFIVQT